MKTNTEMSLPDIILAVVFCILLGANTVAAKISFDGFGLFTVAALRFSTAAVILLWLAVRSDSLKIEKKYLKKTLIMTAIFSVQYFFIFWGLSKTNVSRAVLLIYSQPFFILILSHLFIAGDRITFKKLLGMIIGFCGVLLLFVFKKNIAADFMMGDVLILIAAFLWAANAVYFKSFIHNTSIVTITFYHTLLSVPIFCTGAFIFDEVMFKVLSAQAICALVYQGLVTAFGFIALSFLLKKYQASLVHSFLFISPLSGVLLGILLLNEPFTINIFFALILLSIGIIIVHYSKKNAYGGGNKEKNSY